MASPAPDMDNTLVNKAQEEGEQVITGFVQGAALWRKWPQPAQLAGTRRGAVLEDSVSVAGWDPARAW